MLYDLAESPIVNLLEINGRLTFEDGVKDLHLRAKYIWVRAGELVIGTETSRFQKNAKITLYGEKELQSILFDYAIEGGNKAMINTNSISFYGKLRNTFSRLKSEVYPGDTTIQVAGGLDWVAGDKLGFAPTGMRSNDSDYAIIQSYDSSSGEITLDRALTAYHYGASTSSASTYGGVIDIRGEVFLLSRNIKIAGEDSEAWGCQIVTSEYTEPSGTVRSGMTYMNSVEVYNCSQYDTEKAALRFEGVNYGHSGIENSAIYHGLGWGVSVMSSMNLLFKNNIVFGFVKMGINLDFASNITLNGNLVSNIG